jgi:non-specific serine/threonine protein kinase
LIGRDAEVQRLLRLLADPGVRLITLTGPGGVGKTRLALRVAELAELRELAQVEVVDLSAVEDAAGMMAQIARSFDIWQLARASPLDRIANEIGSRHFLLVLDNLEQIAYGAAELLALIERCPHLTVLTTSRVPLNLSAEQRVPVSTLPMPDRYEAGSAVELFVARARLADPNFALNDRNAPDVLEICRQLDGLPLAIELAAARIRELPPSALVAHLQHTLPILTGGPRDRSQRQRAMRDTISWSYRLLGEDEKALFCSLSVFRGTFSFESAFAIASFGATSSFLDRSHLLEALGTLLNDSLLLLEDEPGVGLRYRMLGTVREFGSEQLALRADEEARVRNAHARLILDTIELDVPGTYGTTSVRWLRVVDANRADLDFALAWSFGRGEVLVGAGLATMASAYWFNLGRAQESMRWLPVASGITGSMHDAVAPEQHAILLIETVLAATMSGQFALAYAVGESAELQATVEQCGPHIHISALTARSMLADFRREFDQSMDLANQAAALARLHPEVSSLPWALTRLGWELLTLGSRDEARDLIAEAFTLFGKRSDPLIEAILSGVLAQISLYEGDVERASSLLVRCFSLQLDLWDPWGAVSDVASAAELALVLGDPELSARLLGACHAGDVQNRIAQQPFVTNLIDQVAERTRLALGAAEFERFSAEGAQCSLPEALELGLGVARRGAGEIPIEPDENNGDLTAREREVLQLVCAGRTDRQIADALFVSRRTVNTHVTHILTKLGAGSRTEAAAEAIRRNLV